MDAPEIRLDGDVEYEYYEYDGGDSEYLYNQDGDWISTNTYISDEDENNVLGISKSQYGNINGIGISAYN